MATKALINYSFSIGYKNIFAKVVKKNNASVRVLEKAGLCKKISKNKNLLFYIEK